MQLYASASDYKYPGNIPGSHFLNPLQLFRRILYGASNITNIVPSVLISVEVTGKNQLEPDQECMGDALVLSHCAFLRNI
jgi:hypothetical protein